MQSHERYEKKKKRLIWEGSFINCYTFGNINQLRRMHAAIALVKGAIIQEKALGCSKSRLMFVVRSKVWKAGVAKNLQEIIIRLQFM